jgi:hypothetical protein
MSDRSRRYPQELRERTRRFRVDSRAITCHDRLPRCAQPTAVRSNRASQMPRPVQLRCRNSRSASTYAFHLSSIEEERVHRRAHDLVPRDIPAGIPLDLPHEPEDVRKRAAQSSAAVPA